MIPSGTLVASRNFVRDVLLTGGVDSLTLLRVLIVIPILTRWLGTEGYGMLAQFKVTLLFLTPLTLLGLQQALLRFTDGEQVTERMRQGFQTSLYAVAGSSAVVGMLLLGCAGPLAGIIFHGHEAAWSIRLLAVFVFLEAIDQLILNYFRSSRKMGACLLFSLAEVAGEVTLMAGLGWARQDLATLLAALLAWKGVVVTVKWALLQRRSGFGEIKLGILRSYLAFGLPLLLSSVCYCLMHYGDRYLLNYFLGIDTLGLYAVACSVGSLVVVLLTPLNTMLFPTTAACWNQARIEEVQTYLRYALKYAVLVAVPVCFLLAVFREAFIFLLAGSEFLSAAASVPWLAAGYAALGIGVVGERAILLRSRSHVILLLCGGLAVGNITLNLVLIPMMGIVGAAVASCVTYGSYAVLTLSSLWKHERVGVECSVLVKSLTAGVVMAAVLRQLGAASLGWVMMSCLLGTAVYLLLLVLLGTFTAVELNVFRALCLGALRESRQVESRDAAPSPEAPGVSPGGEAERAASAHGLHQALRA